MICRGCRSVFFDSFGKLPTFYGINDTFDFVNDQRVQGNSRICGLYWIIVRDFMMENRRVMIRGELDQILETLKDEEGRQRHLYDLAIKSRIVYSDGKAFREIKETDNLSPSVKFIVDNAMKALRRADLFPSSLHIMPAILLRRLNDDGSWTYRFFYSSYNCTIPENDSFTILAANPKMRCEMFQKISDSNFMDVLENAPENTKWRFCGILAITYAIKKIML